ncbi:MAG: 2-hydroxyacyl-CoA dehydratase family protein [Nitrososphaerota archaeon]|nr:2-hydroxyacyl-CoA dehydratase family protein [Nitrososphaerota archaeon]
MEYKRARKALIGTFCNVIPEELIHSFGAVPVRLLGLSRETENADAKLPRWLCTYARRVLEDGLRGNFSYLDGVVGATSDDTKMRLYSTYAFYVKPAFSHIIQTPFTKSEASLNFFSAELQRLTHKLSRFLLCDFSSERLKESIKIYNKFRSLCNKLSSLRLHDTPKISGSDWTKMMLCATSMLKEDFNMVFENELKNLGDFEGIKDYKIRVHVSGTDFYDLELLELIESMGAVIVSDDFFTTTEYALGHVNEEGDLFRSLAEHYLKCSSCALTVLPNASFTKDRVCFIKKAVERSKADAVVMLRDKGCELYGYQCPQIVEGLGDLPTLLLDVDTPISIERYRTRIQAFIESVAG